MSLSEFTPQFLKVDQRGEAVVVDLDVPVLTEDVNLEQLGHELFAIVEQFGCRKLVVSLQNIQMVTSAGLGKLITVHRKMHRHEGTVVFCNLQPAVVEILQSSRLITYLLVSSDVDSALAMIPAVPGGTERRAEG